MLLQYSLQVEGFFEGRVLNCLKRATVQRAGVSEGCGREMALLMADSAGLVDADPVLAELCPASLAACRQSSTADLDIAECLKETVSTGQTCSPRPHFSVYSFYAC